MPKISVIVPVYGVEKYIERCARSLFEQTLDDIEYIFVDDCTPDQSIEILKSIIEEYHLRFAEMNYTVRIERMHTNSGLPAVRMHGIQLATGDYIIHCDSDDWVDRDMYRQMYEKAVDNDTDVVVCDYFSSDGEAHVSHIGVETKDRESLLLDLWKSSDWTVWNKLVRRNVYTENKIIYPSSNMGEDVVLTCQLLFLANKVVNIHSALYYYYSNPSSITKAQSEEKIFKNFTGCRDNVKIVQDFYANRLSSQNKRGLFMLKYSRRNLLLPITSNSEYLRIWKSTFPEINRQIWMSLDISLRDKAKFYLFFWGIRKRY